MVGDGPWGRLGRHVRPGHDFHGTCGVHIACTNWWCGSTPNEPDNHGVFEWGALSVLVWNRQPRGSTALICLFCQAESASSHANTASTQLGAELRGRTAGDQQLALTYELEKGFKFFASQNSVCAPLLEALAEVCFALVVGTPLNGRT